MTDNSTGLRLLHITECPEGGVLTYLVNLVGIQARSPDIASIDVLSPAVNAAGLRESVGSLGVGIHGFFRETRSIPALFRLAIATLRLVLRNRPDIVCMHSTLAGGVVRLCLFPIPGRPRLIYMPHGWSFHPKGKGHFLTLRRIFERLLAPGTDRIVFVSKDERRLAFQAGISTHRSAVVLTGIPSTASAPRHHWQRKRRVLFVGRFDHQKGFDTYLEVLRLLDGQAEGLVAGAAIVNKCSNFDIPSNVTLLGWCSRERVAQLYQEADILLMPSLYEGMPMVALEAMRAGLPVFALRTGPMPEVVEDGVTGRLFANNEPRPIADAIAAVRDEELQAFSEASQRQFPEKFTADRMAREMLETYFEVMGTEPDLARLGGNLRGLNPAIDVQE